MFVHTYFCSYAIIIDVPPPIHYIVFATPHKTKYLLLKGAVALANIFAGRQPYFLPKMASKSVMVPMPFYKRSSFIDIPFGMPYFKLFYF